MLPPFIIEQIRQREEEKNRARREDNDRPRLELPLDRYPAPRRAPSVPDEEDDPNRGVIILDLG
ncbi:MAG TPA: hypothetical protein VLS89_04245 [Candidatus Nanopelagicales bacterium]|nr:hypothetical protein [Candidatus Nanopelagicales bacterium]